MHNFYSAQVHPKLPRRVLFLAARRWATAFASGLALIGLATVLRVSAASAGPPEVNPALALQIGPNAVSVYAVEKNFARFVDGERASGQPPSAESTRRWFEGFLAKQVMIADALSAGYDQRPETRKITERMERQILTQPTGPLYALLAPSAARSDEELKALYAQTAFIPEVVGVRLQKERMADLGPNWRTLDEASRLMWLRSLRGSKAVLAFHEGPLPWPRDPFPEIASALVGAADNSWLEKTAADTLTLVYVRSTKTLPLRPFEERREGFKKLLAQQALEQVHRERHAQLLKQTGARFYEQGMQTLMGVVKTLVRPEIPADQVEAIKSTTLAMYRPEHDTITIDVGAWVDFFNQLMIRRLPSNLDELRQNLETMIVTTLDEAEARRRGLDQEPRFLEDRRNFIHYQALELFEQERLAAEIEPSAAEIAQYRAEHAADYTVVVEARGVRLHFETEDAALQWAGQSRSVTEEAMTSAAIKNRSSWTLARAHPSPELANWLEPILQSPERTPLGPMNTPEGWIVLVKLSSVREPLPLAVVEKPIRALLLRQRLDEKELQWARGSAAKYNVVDTLPYTKFGLSVPPSRPWSAE